MTTWNRTAGAVQDTFVAYLDGEVDGTPASGETEVFLGEVLVTTLTASTVSGVDRNGTPCLVHTGQLDTWLENLPPPSSKTTYRLRHWVTFAGGPVLDWPEKGHDELVVGA